MGEDYVGHWALDIGHWTLDIGHWALGIEQEQMQEQSLSVINDRTNYTFDLMIQ